MRRALSPSANRAYGTRLMAYRAIDHHVYDRVRHFLVRRHKVPSRGTHRFPAEAVFGALGVLRLRRVHLGAPPCASSIFNTLVQITVLDQSVSGRAFGVGTTFSGFDAALVG